MSRNSVSHASSPSRISTPGVTERGADLVAELRPVAMDEQRLGRVAHPRALRLRIDGDRDRGGSIGGGVDVDVAVPAGRRQHRDPRVAQEPLLQLLAAAGDDDVGRRRIGQELVERLVPAADGDDRVRGHAATPRASRARCRRARCSCGPRAATRAGCRHFPDLMQSAAASTATFGRASKTTITTPSGTRSLRTRIPFSSVKSRRTAPIGSGRSAIVSTPAAMAGEPTPIEREPVDDRGGLAGRPGDVGGVGVEHLRRAPLERLRDPGEGIVSGVAVERGENARGRRGREPRARMRSRSRSHQHQIVAAHGLGQTSPPGEPGQLARLVAADADREPAAVGADQLDGVSRVERAVHRHQPDRQQACSRARPRPCRAPSSTTRLAADGRAVAQPQLVGRGQARRRREPGPGPTARRCGERPRLEPRRDHGLDAAGAGRPRGRDLAPDPTRAPRREPAAGARRPRPAPTRRPRPGGGRPAERDRGRTRRRCRSGARASLPGA